jgi:hypothetical protein
MELFPQLKNRMSKFERGEKLITKETKLTSMGSCFAFHISNRLLKHGYNYLVHEPIRNKIVASAHWDFVYNSACMRQIFEYSFKSDWEVAERWWPVDDMHLVDPYRRGTSYLIKDARRSFNEHRAKSRKAIEEAEVIILTLGLAETWRSKVDGATFFQVPPNRVLDLNKHEFYIQTPEDVRNDLASMYRLLREHDSEAKIILTVSPVPLNATFRDDVDVITANSVSKSIVRVGADLFMRETENVYYFPSYEIAAEIADRWRGDDGRHLRWKVITSIMEMFERNWTVA